MRCSGGYLPSLTKQGASFPSQLFLSEIFFFFSHHLFHCGFSSTPIFQAANCEQLLGTFPMHQTSIIIIIFFFFSASNSSCHSRKLRTYRRGATKDPGRTKRRAHTCTSAHTHAHSHPAAPMLANSGCSAPSSPGQHGGCPVPHRSGLATSAGQRPGQAEPGQAGPSRAEPSRVAPAAGCPPRHRTAEVAAGPALGPARHGTARTRCSGAAPAASPRRRDSAVSLFAPQGGPVPPLPPGRSPARRPSGAVGGPPRVVGRGAAAACGTAAARVKGEGGKGWRLRGAPLPRTINRPTLTCFA